MFVSESHLREIGGELENYQRNLFTKNPRSTVAESTDRLIQKISTFFQKVHQDLVNAFDAEVGEDLFDYQDLLERFQVVVNRSLDAIRAEFQRKLTKTGRMFYAESRRERWVERQREYLPCLDAIQEAVLSNQQAVEETVSRYKIEQIQNRTSRFNRAAATIDRLFSHLEDPALRDPVTGAANLMSAVERSRSVERILQSPEARYTSDIASVIERIDEVCREGHFPSIYFREAKQALQQAQIRYTDKLRLVQEKAEIYDEKIMAYIEQFVTTARSIMQEYHNKVIIAQFAYNTHRLTPKKLAEIFSLNRATASHLVQQVSPVPRLDLDITWMGSMASGFLDNPRLLEKLVRDLKEVEEGLLQFDNYASGSSGVPFSRAVQERMQTLKESVQADRLSFLQNTLASLALYLGNHRQALTLLRSTDIGNIKELLDGFPVEAEVIRAEERPSSNTCCFSKLFTRCH